MRLSVADFHSTYPLGDQIGKGSTARVYQSGASAVKMVSLLENGLGSLVRELDAYSTLSSPYLLPLLDWCYDEENTVALLAFPRGEEVLKSSCSVEDFTHDLCAGVAYLHSRGICHRDLKHSNLVHHEGRIKIIDFGVALHTVQFSDSAVLDYYIYDADFAYHDPECYHGDYTSIRTELYSVARTILHYAKHTHQKLSTSLRDLIGQMLRTLPKRKKLVELLAHPFFEKRPVLVPTVTPSWPEIGAPRFPELFASHLIEAVEYCHRIGLQIRTTFLVVQLYWRYFAGKEEVTNLEVHAQVLHPIVFLAATICGDCCGRSLPKKLSLQRVLFEGSVDILADLRGEIWTSTPWDYLGYGSHLVPALLEMMKLSYTPGKGPTLGIGHSDKDVLTSQVLTLSRSAFLRNLRQPVGTENIKMEVQSAPTTNFSPEEFLRILQKHVEVGADMCVITLCVSRRSLLASLTDEQASQCYRVLNRLRGAYSDELRWLPSEEEAKTRNPFQ